MYKKGDIIKVKITDMGKDGEGIGKLDTFPFFIKDAIIGDTVEASVMKSKKHYAFAKLIRILEPSVSRVSAACPVARPCGGCQIQELSYDAQLEFKRNQVFEDLVRIGDVSRDHLKEIFEPVIGMDDPWRYRNKSIYPVAPGREGEAVAGFFAARTHSVIACEDCLIGAPENSRICEIVLSWMKENDVAPYDEREEMRDRLCVRHIFIRKGFATGQIQVCLVVTQTGQLPGKERLISSLMQVPGVKSICVNINPDRTNVIFGDKLYVLSGNEYIEDELMGLKFRISPKAFYQVNPVQTEKLYSTALEFAGLRGDEYVWDICCGIGTITLSVAARLKESGGSGKVLGLEIVPEAIEDAKINTKLNGLYNADFVCAPAQEYLPRIVEEKGPMPDVIIVDPPRSGLFPETIDAMLAASPSRIVYVSCDPSTLARDIKLLIAGGYKLARVRPTDMFCHSCHVETCCLLKRKE